jgi:hypothetical protein
MNKIEELEMVIKFRESENHDKTIDIQDYTKRIDKLSKVIEINVELIAQFKAQLEELKKASKKRWRAEYNEGYWSINYLGKVGRIIELHEDCDDYKYNSGNYYRTEQQAERAKFEMLFLQKLKDFALENNESEAKNVFACSLNGHNIYCLYVSNINLTLEKIINIPFDCISSEKALELFKDELKRYFLRED